MNHGVYREFSDDYVQFARWERSWTQQSTKPNLNIFIIESIIMTQTHNWKRLWEVNRNQPIIPGVIFVLLLWLFDFISTFNYSCDFFKYWQTVRSDKFWLVDNDRKNNTEGDKASKFLIIHSCLHKYHGTQYQHPKHHIMVKLIWIILECCD